MIKENLKKIIRPEYLILLAILILAAIFRFYKLRTVPDWFMDEGEFIRLADYLSKGNFDFLGIRNSLLLIGRPPLFLWILAGTFKLFGTDILVLRNLTVLCSILSIGICYSFVRQTLGRTSAFYTALLLAILPEYIYNNRIGFTYNWTSLWVLFSVFALWKYLKQDSQQWLVVACLSAGIAFASDYIGIISILVLVLVLTLFHPTRLWNVILVGIPLLVSILPVFAIGPGSAWQDLLYTFTWGSRGGGSLVLNLTQMIAGYSELVGRRTWIVLGMAGIFTLSDQRLRGLILLAVGGIFVLFSYSRGLVGHYLLLVLPFLMIGAGSFLEKSIAYIYTFLRSSIINLNSRLLRIITETWRNFFGSIVSTLIVFVLVFLPITWMILLNINTFMIGPVNPSLALQWNPFSNGFTPAVDAEAIANEISPTLKRDDFVIAPGVISWMLPSNAADARTVAVYEYGGKTLGMGDFDSNRFTVNSSISNAKYAVVDNSWRLWMVDLAPEIATILKEVSNWPILMTQGDVQLFCNPIYCH